MKYIALLLLMSLSAACGKTSTPCPEGDPGEYFLYFELDEAFPDDVKVEVSSMVKSVDVKTGEEWEAESIQWETLQINSDASEQSGKRLFGPFYYSMGFEPCDLKDKSGWVRDDLYQLRIDGMDAGIFRFRDTTELEPTVRRFNFYLDDEELKVTGDLNMGMADISYVSIPKSSEE